MRTKIFAVILCCTLILSACALVRPDGSGLKSLFTDQNDSTSPPDDSISTLDDLTLLPIDIEYVSYNDDIEWTDTVVELGAHSLSVPDGWIMIDGASYGLVNGAFFVPPEVDLGDFRFNSHIAIEVSEEPIYSEGLDRDYSLESTQKDFFTSMIVSTFSKMGGLSDLKFSVWNMDDDYIYIVDFIRGNESLTMYQTTYYVMNPNQSIIVYATTFGEDSEIPVHEAACHLITNLYSELSD